MKIIKNDSRYILKRIIIGVGIALILGFLKTNNVFALEKDVYLQGNWTGTGSDNSYLSYTRPTAGWDDFIFDFETFSSNLVKWNFNIYTTDTRLRPVYYITYYNESLKVYYYQIFSFNSAWLSGISSLDLQRLNCDPNSTYSDNYYCTFVNNTGVSDFNFNAGFDNISFFISENNVDLSSYSNLSIIKYENNSQDNSNNFDLNLYYNGRTRTLFNSNFLNDFIPISTNIPHIYVDGVELEIENIPSGYSQIDLINYQAVYFVPKNYSTISKENINGVDFINFPFYYQGNFNTGYFNINNNQQIVFTSPANSLNSENEFSFLDTSFPMYYDENNNDLNSYIIYNIGLNGKIRYKSSDFDYYLVQDLSNYSQQITFIDNNNVSQTKTIQFNQTIQEMWEEGFSQDSDDWWSNGFINGGKEYDKLNEYIQLLKLPLRFYEKLLQQVSSNQCNHLEIPIPYVSGNLVVPCLSSVFESVLGLPVYNSFKAFINVLFILTITLANVKFLMITLLPEIKVNPNTGGLL